LQVCLSVQMLFTLFSTVCDSQPDTIGITLANTEQKSVHHLRSTSHPGWTWALATRNAPMPASMQALLEYISASDHVANSRYQKMGR